MVDRTRLAVSGAVLLGVSATIRMVLAWKDYQRSLDQEWMPTYWDYLRGSMDLTFGFVIGAGIVMMIVAGAMKRQKVDDALFRP